MQDNVLSKGYISSNSKKTITVSKNVDLLKHFIHLVRNMFLVLLVLVSMLIVVILVDAGINQFRDKKLPAILDTYEIVTPSMTPTIKVNDTVMVRRVDYKTLKKGDIITFKSSDSRLNGMIITHRINEVIKDSNGNYTFITKGDNNEYVDDASVLPQNIYGKVVVKVPFYTTIKKVIGNPITIALVCVLIFGFIVNKKKNNALQGSKKEIELLSFREEEIEII